MSSKIDYNSLKKHIAQADTPEKQVVVWHELEQVITNSRIPLKEIADELGLKIEEGNNVQILNVKSQVQEIFPKIDSDQVGAEPPPSFDTKENKSKEDEMDDYSSDETSSEHKSGVTVISEVFVPTNKMPISIGSGNGNFEVKGTVERTNFIHEALGSLCLVFKKDYHIFEGVNQPNMMRKEPYRLVIIPKLNRMILLCEEEGNRSFVICTAQHSEQYRLLSKNELKELVFTGEVKDLQWCDPKKWKIKLIEFLLTETETFKENDIFPKKEKEESESKEDFLVRDKEYYSNPFYVLSDLITYAKELGPDKTPLDLTTTNIKKMSVTCCNGEKVSCRRYLSNAGVQLKLFKNAPEAGNNLKIILNRLLLTAGYDIPEIKKPDFERNKDYYENPKYVRKDLIAFAEELGSGKTPLDLTISNISLLSITCCNGEEVVGVTYLRNAKKELELSENTTLSIVLNRLLRKAGYDVPKIEPIEIKKPDFERDKAYYENPDYVRKDLITFANELGPDKTPLDLMAFNMESLSITCCNGEVEVRGRRYLSNAGIELGLFKKSSEAANHLPIILNKLLRKAGYNVPEIKQSIFERDEKYYDDTEYIREDLIAYAKKLGSNKTPLDLNVSNMVSLSVTCCNGEDVTGLTYLRNAGIKRKMASNSKEANSILGEILDALKYKTGYKMAS